MNRFIRELRRREVFRTAGLYVGICWILIEVSSVVLPTFGVPEWVFRAAIVIAFAGFPVMVVLAWVFDVTNKGIEVQADPTETIVEQLGARKTDFAVIGVLALALGVSLYLNISGEAPPAERPDPVSVLIADFDNTTDEPSFDRVLKEALRVGIEVAPHITTLDRELARDAAQREGIGMLLAGSVSQSGSGYRITVEGIDLSGGEASFTIDENASSRDAMLRAIGVLSGEVREQLGDTTPGDQQGQYAETFVSASLEAARAYTMARQFHIAGKLEEAAEYYEQAIELDPQLGRAVAGLAFVEFELGQTGQAEARWSNALSAMDTMTERERLQTLGKYYTLVEGNDEKALATWSELLEKYPADVGALESHAALRFDLLDFTAAAEETRKILQIYPSDHRSRAKLASYAMYGGDWETATTEAEQVIASDPANGTVYLPVAVAALVRGQIEASRDAYRNMASTSKTEHGASVAELGLADIDLFVGQVGAADERLKAGITSDTEAGNHGAAAVKHIALAQSYVEQEMFAEATAAVAVALQLGDGDALKVPAAIIYIQSGDLTSASAIADELAGQAHEHGLAYARMLRGMILEHEGVGTESVFALREAVDTADLWLIRFQLGKAYLRAGYYTESLDELMMSRERVGEAASVFLDDMPTYRSAAELPYWIGRAQEELGMGPAARESYEDYVELRPQGGTLVQDANERIARLN